MNKIKSLKQKYYIKKFKKITNKNTTEEKINKYMTKIITYSSYFDKKYYQKTYNIENNPEKYYLTKGFAQGHNPSSKFSTSLYYQMYPDVKQNNINPLFHYEVYGKKENRLPGIPIIEQGVYKPQKIKRTTLRYISKIINYNKIKNNKDCKILVILHLFYMNSVDEVIEYLKNLNSYNYELIITYMDGMYYQNALDKIKEFKPDTKFKKYNNKGFDIGPFIDIINKINLAKYDIVIKLQTKSTSKNIYAYQQVFKGRDWFLNLFNGVIGSFSVHKTIDKLYNNNKYGIAAANNLIVEDPPHKQELVMKKKTINKNNKAPKNYKFIAGSCFAIKSDCLKEIQKEKITIKDFDNVKRGYFTLGHIMERTICFTITNQNYDFYGNKVDFIRHLKYHKIEKKLQNLSTINLYKIKNIKIDTNTAIKYLEMGFEKKHEIISIKLEDIKLPKENNLDKIKYNKLKESIKKHNYDNKHLIIINQNNEIIDGLYRINILKELNNKDYEIKVLKVYFIQIDINKIHPFSTKISLY